MPEYYFKSVPSGIANYSAVEVAKFDGGDIPVATYVVTTHISGRMTCDCPAGSHQRHCKHLDMVRKWKTQQAEEA